jgi:hypothetical protein
LVPGWFGHARAGVIVWDASPGATGASDAGAFANLMDHQILADRISFAGATQIDGMDIYTSAPSSGAAVGQSATVRLYADAAGAPGALLDSFTQTVSAVDADGAAGPGSVRVHVDLTSPLLLDANTPYWIGMSGTSVELNQEALTGGTIPLGDGLMAEFTGADNHFQGMAAVGDMAFRLEGQTAVAAVPEPASLTLAGLGAVGLLGYTWRRQKAGPPFADRCKALTSGLRRCDRPGRGEHTPCPCQGGDPRPFSSPFSPAPSPPRRGELFSPFFVRPACQLRLPG